MLTNVTKLDDVFPSDHYVLYFNIYLHLPKFIRKTRHVFNFKRANIDLMYNKLSEMSLSSCTIDSSDMSLWASWSSQVKAIIEQCVPKAKVRSSNDPPWFDSEARHLVNQKRTLHRKAKRCRTVITLNRYKAFSNHVRAILR